MPRRECLRPRVLVPLRELVWAQRQAMTTVPRPTALGEPVLSKNPRLTSAVAANLAQFKGPSRQTPPPTCESSSAGAPPGTLTRSSRRDLELYVRWLRKTRRYMPSTVSRRNWVVARFYRTCGIDGLLPRTFARPPCQRGRRPSGSPTCSSKPC